MALFNVCPEAAEQQGPFKVKLCPALALKVFFKSRTSLSERCFKSFRMKFANISSSAPCICLKALFFSSVADLHLHLLGRHCHCALFPLLIKQFFPEEKLQSSNSHYVKEKLVLWVPLWCFVRLYTH